MASSEFFRDQTTWVYTWVVYGVICQVINVFGIATNIINIICFSKQGFNDSVNITLLGLSLSDLGSLATMILSCLWLTPSLLEADLPFDPMDVMYLTSAMPHFSFTRVSSCLTALITIERCLCITLPLQIKNIVTPTRTGCITICIFVIFFCSSTPVYAVNTLGTHFSTVRNKTILGLVSTNDRETVEIMSFTVNNFIIPFAAFLIIIVCTIIISVQLKNQAKWKTTITSSSQVDISSRRNHKTAKMVLMISILFIVCFIPVSLNMLSVCFIPDLSIHGKYMHVSLICGGIGYILENINSSSNILIYYRMSSKYRMTFRNIFTQKPQLGIESKRKY